MNILKWHGLDFDPMKINESLTTKAEIGRVDTAFNESTNESGITVLYPKIEAIHAGRTRNYNSYSAEKLKGDADMRSGVYSWTAPYPKPVIYNHDIETEASGRVYSASFSEFTNAGRPGIIVTPKITSEKAIKDILGGRLLTVSIGATTDAAVCSVCHTDIVNEGFCGHYRGEQYDGEVCEWVSGNLFFDELSWVNVPADSDAMVVHDGTNAGFISTGESTKKDEPAIVVRTKEGTPVIAADPIIIPDSTSVLTEGSEGVKSVSDSNKKEENILAQEENKVVEATEEAIETPVEETETVVVEEAKVEEETVVEENSAEELVEEPVVEEQPEEIEQVTKEELDQAKSDLAEAKATIEELKEANTALAKEFQETVASLLVDLRIATGKEDNREEALVKYSTRSLESLADSISDILGDKPAIQTARTVEKVEMPKGEAITESKELASDKQVVISNEEALISLLTGRR